MWLTAITIPIFVFECNIERHISNKFKRVEWKGRARRKICFIVIKVIGSILDIYIIKMSKNNDIW